jgi:hypothetical protein
VTAYSSLAEEESSGCGTVSPRGRYMPWTNEGAGASEAGFILRATTWGTAIGKTSEALPMRRKREPG